MPADEQALVRAPGAAGRLVVVVLPTAYLAIPGADGEAPSPVFAWLLAGGLPLVGMAAWIVIDQWLRPGTVLRALRHDLYAACSVAVTYALAGTVVLLALVKVQRPGVWFALFLVQLAWMIAGFATGTGTTARRRKRTAGSAEGKAEK